MTTQRRTYRHDLALLLSCTALGLTACAGAADPEPARTQSQSPPRCRPGPGASGTPTSIDDAVRLVNSLPAPVSVSCFLESLDRPLHATATHNTVSLQPAAGRRSPRVFLLSEKLVMSVVIDGKTRDLVEFGEYVTETRTLKGEIGFPATAALPAGEPYQRIRSDNAATGVTGTSCRFCHAGEEPVRQIGGMVGYVSEALKPSRRMNVPIDDLRWERQACDPAVEPARCELLNAFLGHGDVIEATFPEKVRSFFD